MLYFLVRIYGRMYLEWEWWVIMYAGLLDPGRPRCKLG